MEEASEISPAEKNTSPSTGSIRNPFATDTVIDDSQESLHEVSRLDYYNKNIFMKNQI